jgi:hypothetical protein
MALIRLSGEIALGDLLVAVGTLLLAFFTWRLARQTRREVGLSAESIDMAREGIEAQDRPYVIASPVDPNTYVLLNTSSGLTLRLWNIGKGPGIVQGLSLDQEGERIPTNLQAQVVLTQNGQRDFLDPPLWLKSDLSDTPPVGDELGSLRLAYTDASGVPYETVSRLLIRRKHSNEDGTTAFECECRNFDRDRVSQHSPR